MIRFKVPYTGNADVFRIRPSQFNLNPPRARIGAGEVVIEVKRTDQDVAEFKKEYENIVRSIEGYLGTLRTDFDGLRNPALQIAQKTICDRRTKIKGDDDLLDSLGFEQGK